MKRNFSLCVFIMLFLIGPSLTKLNADSPASFPDTEPLISMDFQDAGLKNVLKILSMQSGLNFIASEGVQDRKVTLYLDKVPLKQAMDKIFKANNLAYELYKDANIFIIKDLGKLQTEMITKVFYLKNATVSSSSLKEEMGYQLTPTSSSSSSLSLGTGGTSGSSSSSTTSSTSTTAGGGGSGKWAIENDVGITKAVKKLLSQDGSVIEDYRTNSLIITDTPMKMSVISQVIASLDVPIPQVVLEVEMLDVSKDTVDNLGFDFSGAGSFGMTVLSAARPTAFPLSAFAPEEPQKGPFTYGKVSFTNLSLIFDFLTTKSDTKILARPKIRTLNNETAEISIATNESVGITTNTSGSSSITTQSVQPERVQTGVILRVTPQINVDNGEITMMIYPLVADTVPGNSFIENSQQFQFRDPQIRSTKSVIKVKDAETVIIGGLMRNDVVRQEVKLPILGDIPLIGGLFRHVGGTANSPDKNQQRELLVFITPHIIKDAKVTSNVAANSNIEAGLVKNNTFPIREQYAGAEVNRSALVASVLNNYKKER